MARPRSSQRGGALPLPLPLLTGDIGDRVYIYTWSICTCTYVCTYIAVHICSIPCSLGDAPYGRTTKDDGSGKNRSLTTTDATEHTIVCGSVSCRAHTKLPLYLPRAALSSTTAPPLPPTPPFTRPADLMHGYQFATPRAILHIGWYWTIHHAARHRHIAHPPLTLQMLLPTSTRCASRGSARRAAVTRA